MWSHATDRHLGFLNRRPPDRLERFEVLVLPHLDALYSAAVHLSRNSHDAEDLVQETCLKAYRSLDGLADPERCRGWLIRIMTNHYINAYRRNQRSPEVPLLEVHDAAAEASSECVPLERLIDDDLKSALDALREDYRQAVLLCDVDGFAYEEIAEIMGCPIGTVRSHIHRGRCQLRAHLERLIRTRKGAEGGSCA